MQISPLVIISFLFLNAHSQDLISTYSNSISEDSIRKDVYILSSDSLEGRETGKPGQKKAAAIIAGRYLSLGLEPAGVIYKPTEESQLENYYKKGLLQNHPVRLKTNKGRNLSVNGSDFLFGKDFIYPGYFKDTAMFFTDFIFIASGNKTPYSAIFNSEKHVNKNLLLYDVRTDSIRPLLAMFPAFSSNLPSSVFVVTSEEKIKNFLMHGFDFNINQAFPLIFISEKTAEHFFSGIEFQKISGKVIRNGKGISKSINGTVSIGLLNNTELLRGQNVIAYIKGSEIDTETVVISAHYDHLGRNDTSIFYGADDNASGTSAVLELARVFSAAKKAGNGPKRNILFLNVSGEEKGLLGSAWFVEHPTLSLNSMIADLNIDMIGRIDPYHDSTGVSGYVYVIGSDKMSTELHKINEASNSLGPAFELNYKFNDPADPNHYYTRSDHYNFVKNGIPVIFYFDGTHIDYHTPGDTPDKINYKLLTERTRLVFLTAWQLANQPERIKIDVKPDTEK